MYKEEIIHLKKYILIVLLTGMLTGTLFGVLTDRFPSERIIGKYISGQETLEFKSGGQFNAIEYDAFNRRMSQFYGIYTINKNELILYYTGTGIVQNFRISDDKKTITETGRPGNLSYTKVQT